MNHISKTTAVYFSPTRSSKQVALAIAGHLCDGQSNVCDLTYLPVSPRSFDADECVVVAVPVYGGHVPATAKERLCQLQGNGTPAVAIVTYGNRDYEQALTDLADILRGQGFRVIAAATFIGEHSYCTDKYPIGKGRPDQNDLDCAAHFGDAVRRKIQEGDLNEVDVTAIPRPTTSPDDTRAFVEGIQQMKQKAAQQAATGQTAPAVPVTDASLCTLCGSCVRLCPTDAIRIDGGQLLTDPAHCIKCCACVKGCPSHARTFTTPFAPLLAAIFTTRKEPCTLV